MSARVPSGLLRRVRVATVLASLGLATVGTVEAWADVNICWRLLEPLWIPPTPLDVGECIEANAPLCALGMLHCCLPTCRQHPDCNLGGTFVDGHWEDVACEVMDPEDALEQLLRSQLRPADDALPILSQVAQVQIEALSLQARRIPPDLAALVNGILASPEASGLPRFEPRDVRSALILPERTDTAGIYLVDAGTQAITLDRLIILRNQFFDELVSRPAPTAAALRTACLEPQPYKDAVSLLLHELVHVRQWDRLGRDTFVNNYLIETIFLGYGNDAFESEAFALAAGPTGRLPVSAVDAAFRDCAPAALLLPLFL